MSATGKMLAVVWVLKKAGMSTTGVWALANEEMSGTERMLAAVLMQGRMLATVRTLAKARTTPTVPFPITSHPTSFPFT
jgi:hypothetical protein